MELETLKDSFSAVSTANFASKHSFESSRRDLQDLHVRLGPWDSNLKTKKNASGKRPPHEAHGSGDETIRPQRSSEAERNSEKKVHEARCSDSARRGFTESKNVCLLHRSERQISARDFHKFSYFANFALILLLTFSIVVQISPIFMSFSEN